MRRLLRCWPLLAAGILVFALHGHFRAGEQPAGEKAGDQRVYDLLRNVINKGADLYNGGDQAGCYRLYQGALMALQPMLGNYPDLQKAIETGLANAERMPSVSERAFALRKVIDSVRAKTNPNPKATAGGSGAGKPKTLWDRLGGEANVKKVVDDFVATVAANPKVDFTRGGKYKLDDEGVANLKQKLVELISAVSGGPLKYTGKGMKEVHKGMGITDAEFNATAADLIAALKKNGAKEEDINELVKIVAGTRSEIVEKKDDGKPADKDKGDADKAEDKKDAKKPEDKEDKKDKDK
jgi:hemoglobin